MKKRNFGNFQVELDVDATTKWYAQSKGWGCECSHCRNFLELANKKELPKHIIEILDELNISPEKATYVCELFTDETGIHYQFRKVSGNPRLFNCRNESVVYVRIRTLLFLNCAYLHS